MSKILVTRKKIKEGTKKVYKIGYEQLQNMLKYKVPFAYSVRVEGWACDYYSISNVIISTGYAPIGLDVDYKLRKKYESEAEKIVNNYDINFDERKEKIEMLLNDFIKELTE